MSPSSLLTLSPLPPFVGLMTISLKINCESEVGQRLPTHHLSSTSVPAPNEFISFFDNEVIFIHPCCKYHQRRFKTVPSECQFATYWLRVDTNSILWKKNLDNTWLARFDGRRLPLYSPRQGSMLFMSLVQGVDPWFEANDRPIILYSVNIRRTTSLSAISP